MGQLFVNNGRARLQGAINSTQTTIAIEQAKNLPTSLAVGDWFLLTLAHQNSRYGSDVEVVKVTGVSGSVLTVERGYEGAAVAHAMTDVVEARTTADTHERMIRSAEWEHVSDKPLTATRWPDWNEVTDKPGAFTPVAHTHPWTEVTAKPDQATRWPVWAEVTGKPTNFPPTTHGHAWSQIGSPPTTATRWPNWGEVTDKPGTTASRSSTSTVTLLQAKSMGDHAGSGDHDGRYFTKSQTDGRYLSKADGGTLENDLTVHREGTNTAGVDLEGGRSGSGGAVAALTMTNLLTDKSGAIEAWTDGASHDLEVRGFTKTKLATAVEVSNTLSLVNAGFNTFSMYSDRTTGNIGGIGFFSNGVKKGSLNFTADGKVEVVEGAYFAGSGSGLTNIKGAAIESGTVSINRLPSTTSRTSTSVSHLLTGKAMSDHTGSTDHDYRYHTKTEADGRFVAKSGYNYFNPGGNYASLRARSTTKGDVGLSNVPNLDFRNASNLASGTVPIARISSTSARNSTSESTLLHAKAMRDHVASGDHDNRYLQLDAGKPLIVSGDWNDVITTGFYQGSELLNQSPGGSWRFCIVQQHNSKYASQTMIPFTGGGIYQRHYEGGTWTGWKKVLFSDGDGSDLTGNSALRARGTTKGDVGLSEVANHFSPRADSIVNVGLGSNNPANPYMRRESDNSIVYLANQDGNYPNLRARGTTKADVGLSNVENTAATENDTPNTIMKRNSSGDVWARLFRSSHTGTNSDIGAIYTTRTIGSDYMRPSTPAQVKAALGTTKADVGLGSVDNLSRAHYDGRYLQSGVANASLKLTNREGTDLGTSTGEVVHDESSGLFVASSNAKHSNPALLWSSANFTAGNGLSASYSGEDEPTLSLSGDSFNASGTYTSLRARGTTKADVGLSSVDNYSRAHYDSRYLGKSTKAVDSDKLDGRHASEFQQHLVSTPSGRGIRLSGSDWNNAVLSGFYADSSAANQTPFKSHTWQYTITAAHNHSASYALQIASGFNLDDPLSFRTRSNGNWGDWYEVWSSANHGSGSGLDADRLDGKHASAFAKTSGSYSGLRARATTKGDVGLGSVGNYPPSYADDEGTYALRDAAGDIKARMFRSTFTNLNSNVGIIWTSVSNSGNDFIRPSTPAQVKSALNIKVGDVSGADSTGAVNTFAFLKNQGGSFVGAGIIRSGATLRYASTGPGKGNNPSGSWQCMGRADQGEATLWLRVT